MRWTCSPLAGPGRTWTTRLGCAPDAAGRQQPRTRPCRVGAVGAAAAAGPKGRPADVPGPGAPPVACRLRRGRSRGDPDPAGYGRDVRAHGIGHGGRREGHRRTSPGWLEGVNLFGAVAIEPGSRKSAVHRDMTAPLLDYERDLAAAARPELADAASRRRVAEATLARLEKAVAGAGPETRTSVEQDRCDAAVALDELTVPTEPRLFTAHATPEALASLLFAHNGRMAVLSAEGGILRVDGRPVQQRRPQPRRVPLRTRRGPAPGRPEGPTDRVRRAPRPDHRGRRPTGRAEQGRTGSQ